MKGRNFSFILYSDSESYDYDQVLINCITMCNNNDWSYFYIIHDNDVTEDDTPLKPHTHFFISIDSKKSDTTIKKISKFIGLPENYIEKKNNAKLCILYLAHQSPNSIEKYSYDWHSIKTNDETKLKGVFCNDEEIRNVSAIIDYIDSIGYITYIDFSKFILNNSLWSYYRRSGAIINNLIKEHNERFTKYKRKEDLYLDD